ncbi:Gfo/Idh/MocA family oxidoreductase [Paenibacillus validus]|uniref:Gfo/Idh/MocA family oxidoreductase n=1 Tax=Paenibacillus validus TaxID=44253 RepID=A0A7X2ZEY0_9BACL|nr:MULTISPECIES: Gfo/Idh/MocA family oxidoreductase [Paenibacillus]MED4601407.1 Gfo/Idh/MocA family oxidoreductase [Paenibacillus validus]MED4605048.1 Gfo/Idh/MocA family oxidoreductase [Paenibacillus validus]MUG72901.1 gfo/Idh/MocA family oxidoreductase [Paenibacillus validus]
MRKIKAAILGAGFIGQAHIEAVRRLSFVEVVAIAQSGQDKAEQSAKLLNVPKAYGNYMDLLKDPEIDVIHNCTPNYLHYEINKQILLHGKHLLSEKPLTLTSEEAKELYHLAKEKNLVSGINFNYRQFPMVQHLRGMVRDNELGDIRIVRGNYLQDWLLYDTDYNWRLEPEYGGKTRAIGDIGSHLFDLTQYVTGMKITEVMADTAIMIPQRYKPLKEKQTFQNGGKENASLVDVSTEDYCSVLVKFDNGARGVFTVSQVSAGSKNALVLNIDGSVASGTWKQEEPFRLTIRYRDKPSETVLRDPGLVKKEVLPFLHYPGGHEEGWTESLKNMMQNFYDAVEGKMTHSDSVASFAEGYQIMLIIDAIVKSAKTGTWEKVESIS